MTEMRHLRCDRCDDDIVIRSDRVLADSERGWVYVMGGGLERYDFCPNCWREMLELAKVQLKERN